MPRRANCFRNTSISSCNHSLGRMNKTSSGARPLRPDSRFGGSGIEDCGALLRGLRSLVPRPLIDEGGWCRLVTRADGLPASGLCFEFRLGEPEANADFFVVLVPGSAAERAHIRRGRDAQPDSFEAALAHHLVETGSMVCPLATILEYDVAGAPTRLMPSPAVFQGLWQRPSREQGLRDPRIVGRLVTGLVTAVGRTPDMEEVASVQSMVTSLPPSGRLVWVGAMPGREPRMVRLQIQGIAADCLEDNLRQVGWPGSTGAVLDVLDVMKNRFAGIGVQMDLSARGLLPRLGLEFFLPSERQSRGFVTRVARAGGHLLGPLLASLEDASWSVPRKSRGLLEFSGREFVLGDGMFEVRKEVNHVKISIEEGRACTAKAYGRMLFRPLDP